MLDIVKTDFLKITGELRYTVTQDFRKKINGRLAAILDFITAKFVMGYPYVRNHILFYIHGAATLHFFELSKYNKIIKI